MSPETPHDDTQWSSPGKDPSRDPELLGNLFDNAAAQIEAQRELSAARLALRDLIEGHTASDAELQAARERVTDLIKRTGLEDS